MEDEALVEIHLNKDLEDAWLGIKGFLYLYLVLLISNAVFQRLVDRFKFSRVLLKC